VPVFGTNGPVGFTATAQVDGPGVIIGRKGAYRGVHYSSEPFWVIDTAFYLVPHAGINTKWAYYALQLADINGLDSGSAIPSTTRDAFYSLDVLLPSMEVQTAIAEVLSALDEKIAANTKLVLTLDTHMALSFNRAISEGSQTVALGDAVTFHNRRRIPLSSRERRTRPGSVPYYGASGAFGTVDEAIFDQPLVLVGEDGSVMNPDGTPIVQYVWGPSWVNNHAHVLTGARISTELLYLAISRKQVATLVTGAVQPKINMGNLKRLELTLPTGDALKELERFVGAEVASKRLLVEEKRTLATTRDTLLPQLMSGKLRVKDAENLLSDVL